LLNNRTRWRALAVVLGAGALLMAGGGAAHASTGSVPGQIIAAHAAQTVTLPSCTSSDNECEYDSGLVPYGDSGGCLQQTDATYDPQSNILDVTVNLQNPNLFTGCPVYVTVYFGMTSGPPVPVGPFYLYACGILDFTCSSNVTHTTQISDPLTTSQLKTLEYLSAGASPDN
jgi:hypothetical protein